jgi:hypothetical protein
MICVQPRRAHPDYGACKALARPVDHPGRIDRPVVLHQPQLVGVFLGVVHVREPRVELARQQVARDDRLGWLIDDRLKAREVQIPARSRDDPQALVLLHIIAEDQAE